MGAYCAQQPELEAGKVRAFLLPIPVLTYGTSEAARFAAISARLRGLGQLLGGADAMIAATAAVHRCTVITKNIKHFGKVEHLPVANWADSY